MKKIAVITLHGMGIDIEIRRNVNVRTFQPKIPELRSRMDIYKKGSYDRIKVLTSCWSDNR